VTTPRQERADAEAHRGFAERYLDPLHAGGTLGEYRGYRSYIIAAGLKITFDPAKRERTLRERNLDFHDAPKVFAGPRPTFEDTRFEYPEPRYITVGLLDRRMLILVWTPK
jgi:uncharacterized DUF497 family protein